MSAAARAVGVDEKTARRRLAELNEPSRAQLHARACARGHRAGRKAITDIIALARRIVVDENAAGVGLEPRDLAALMNAISKANDSLVNVADREDRRQAAKLTRARMRAELAALKAAGVTSGDLQVVVQIAPPKKESE
jgi:hypothetical protein